MRQGERPGFSQGPPYHTEDSSFLPELLMPLVLSPVGRHGETSKLGPRVEARQFAPAFPTGLWPKRT